MEVYNRADEFNSGPKIITERREMEHFFTFAL